MRRIVITAVAVLMTFSIFAADNAEAGRRNGRVRVSQRSSGNGFFANLMEVERKKNAWLRATFLGR